MFLLTVLLVQRIPTSTSWGKLPFYSHTCGILGHLHLSTPFYVRPTFGSTYRPMLGWETASKHFTGGPKGEIFTLKNLYLIFIVFIALEVNILLASRTHLHFFLTTKIRSTISLSIKNSIQKQPCKFTTFKSVGLPHFYSSHLLLGYLLVCPLSRYSNNKPCT